MWATDVTYAPSSRSAVSTSGTAPTNSTVTFYNTYNNKAQMTGGNTQTLTLSGYNGYTITQIKLSMKSNSGSGAGKLRYSTDNGSTWTYIVGTSASNGGVAFDNTAWNGSFTTTYTDITKDVNIICGTSNVKIEIEATANSLYCQSYTLTYKTSDTRTATTTSITVPDGFKTDLANGTNVDAGQLSATVTYGSPSTIIAGAPITWTSTNTDAATVDGSGNVTLKAVGTTTIKAQYEGTTTEYQPSEASYVLNVVNTYAKGQLNNPYTVAEAKTAIDATEGKLINDVYVTGIISRIDGYSDSKYITYWISDDGTTTNQFEVYKGLGIGGASFSAATDLRVGDVVKVSGTIKYYSGETVYEFNKDNQLVTRETKTDPTFTISPDITEKELDAYSQETVDITLTTNTDGAVTCESDDEDVATVALNAGVYTITAKTVGTANITIKSATTATYYPASKTIEVTVTDDRDDSGIAFAESSVTKTWGQSFTGQELTNENNVPVTYSSTDETVATVDENTGEVEVLKAGTTTIKATFTGDATYFAKVVSYTLTINKASAGLSFSPNSFELDLNESFTEPTLNNPNNLTVTYASNNTDVATVDENTGELTTLVTSAVGTATITATFTGNDNYNSGSASYTIKVIDSYAKGGKNNPYSVAEVEALTEDKTGVYVTGYIVGCVNSSNSKAYKTTTSEWHNANLLLSDDRDISFTEGTSIGKKTADNLIPVQLPTNDLKNTWGISITSGAVIGYKILLKGNGLDYFTGKGVKSTSEINAVTAPVTITAAEYATYNNANFALDFSETGITVYTAQDKETSVGLTEVTTGQIPANTPVVLHKAVTSSTTINVPVIASADAIEGTNDLRVKDSGDDVENMYVLAKPSGKNVGFYPWTGTKLNAGKIYLQGKGSYGAREFLGFDGTATGIANVDINANDNFDANAPMYNLAGQRVNKSYKGVVIVNGKKYMNK